MSSAGSVKSRPGKGLWTLVRAQLMTSFGLNMVVHEKDKKKHGRYIARLIAYLFLSLMVIGYSYGIGYGLGFLGMSSVVPAMSFAVSCIMILLFTMLKSVAVLFGFKDYDMLMSLPVSNKVVITSKFLYMYVSNELLTMGILIPMAVAYSLWTPVHAVDILIWVLAIPVAPLIPMTIATVLGAVIAAITSRVKHKNLISVILSFIMIFAIMLFNIRLNSSQESDAEFYMNIKIISSMLTDKMNRLYPPVRLFQNSLSEHSVLPVLLLILISVVWYLIFVTVVSIGFNQINSRLKARQAKAQYKMQELKTSSPLMALVKKEIGRFLSSPGYIVNCTVGSAMAIIFAVFCVIKGPEEVIRTFAAEGFSGFTTGILCAIPFFASALLGMTCTSAASLSLEGKNLWIVKSLPLEPKIILKSKIIFDLLIGVSTAFICGVLLLIAIKPADFITAVWFIATPVSFKLFTAVWGMFLNVKLPNYEWENEMVVIKQGGASTISVFSGLILGGVLGVVVLLLGFIGFAVLAAAVATALLLLAAAALYRVLMNVKAI
ncbi:MAG: hypothetical protein Q4G60_08425 [bacterium]|nr:hypothetical protein [bacterium]